MIRAKTRRNALGSFLIAANLAGCASVVRPSNHDPVAEGAGYQAQYRSEISGKPDDSLNTSPSLNLRNCANAAEIDARAAALLPEVERLSAGDLVEIRVGNDDILSRAYKVSQDGMLRLPHLHPVRAQSLSVDHVEAAISKELLVSGLYRSEQMVSVRITDAGAARVFISGAVFEAGAASIGGVDGQKIDTARQKAMGWTADGRRLSRALQSAGGVRPDADLARVSLVRGKSKIVVDIRAALTGKPYSDPILLNGDQIIVESRGCFQEALVVPSAITTPGVKVYMSNLTQPAAGNAIAAIGKDTQELRYGTRFMQAVVAMNCVGGAKATNANRYAVLFTHNPVTNESIVVSRSIEELVRRADRDNFNPYILPGDALACYDSVQTNLISVAQGLGSILSTASAAPKVKLH